MIQPEKIQQIVDIIVKDYQPEKIILFGSHARGDARKDSDLDLIIIKQTEVPWFHRGWEVRKLLLGKLVPMDLKIYTPEEYQECTLSQYSFIQSVVNESVVLYERKD